MAALYSSPKSCGAMATQEPGGIGIIGIFKALNILHSKKLADAWVLLPNSNRIFAGQTPLAYMMKGGVPAMQMVRRLLDARRGGR
mgnify:CR=1 FL=1